MTLYEIIEIETGQKVDDDTPLDDLKIDSLEFLQLLIEISDATGKQVPDVQIGGLQTVGDIARQLA